MHKALVIKSAFQKNLICESVGLSETQGYVQKDAAFFYDLDAYEANILKLINAFPNNFIHMAAIKANPLEWFIKYRNENPKFRNLIGAETASLGELVHSLNCGVPCSRIVFDSPCKTYAEIKFAIEKGILLNLDNIEELDRVEEVLNDFEGKHKGLIGIRINPLVGSGAIEQLSVSTKKSKFGCPLPSGSENELNEAEIKTRNQLIDLIARKEFVSCVHVHVGSGGMGLKKLCHGVKVAINFVKEVNLKRQKNFIQVIDIGGGIAVNFNSEAQIGLCSIQSNVYEEYSSSLKVECPELFDETIFKQVITEFGASLNMNFGWFASKIEYLKSYEGFSTVIIHGGSDLFLRECYCPEQFAHHRFEVFSLENNQIYQESSVNSKSVNIGGPLCFAGDILGRDISFNSLELSTVRIGDICIVSDCGANSISLKNMHCSRPIPGVYGYSVLNDIVQFSTIKNPQSLQSLTDFWKI